MSEPVDPPRLAANDSASPLAELFRAAERDVASDRELSRVAARLQPELPSIAAPRTASPRPWHWLALGGGLLGALGLLIGLARPRTATVTSGQGEEKTVFAPAPASPSATAASVSTPLPAPTVAPPSVAPLASATSNVGSSAASSAGAAPHFARAESKGEAALLEQARRALAGDPERALTLTRQHQRQFPNGVLRQEREVIAIAALRKLGRVSEANTRANSFDQQFPDSAHRRAVEKSSPK
jgi:hypothetical protein